MHPIYIPVYTKADSLAEHDVYYSKLVQPSPAPYTPSPLVSIYVASTPKPYISESEKVYGVESADLKYAAPLVPKISYATPVTKQEYAKAIYQSTVKPSYGYSSEKYAEELSSKYASSAYSSGDYSHEGKSYSIPIQYQFVAPAVGYVSSTPAPLKYHSSAEASYSSLNKASSYDHHSYDHHSHEKASYYPSSTPVYPSSTPVYSKSHSYIKQSPSYVSSTPAYVSYPSSSPAYVSYPSSTPAYPTYSSTLAPYPAYEPSYVKPLHVASHAAYAADEKESAEHYYAHLLNGDYGHAQVKYAGSYSKEYLPPTANSAPAYNAYSGSHGAGYKDYSGQSYSNSYYNSGASGHHNAYEATKSYQSPKYPSPYQYSSQYQYSSAPLTYSPYQPAYSPAIKSYSSYSPAPAAHGYSGHSDYDASKYSSSSQYSSHNHGYAVKEASHASKYDAHGHKYVPVAVYPASSADLHQYSAGYAHQSSQYAAAQEAAEYAAQAHAAEYAAAQASAHQAASQYAAAAHAKQASHYAAAHQSAAHSQYSSGHAASGNKYSASYYGHSAVPSATPTYVQYAQPAYPVVQYATAAPQVAAQYHVPAYKSYSSGSEHSHKYHGVQSVASQHEEYYVSIADGIGKKYFN